MNALTDEIVGKTLTVKSSQNKDAIGINGTIIDETKETLTIRTKNGDKKLIKKQHLFEINGEEISGLSLFGRPEERIKKWMRK